MDNSNTTPDITLENQHLDSLQADPQNSQEKNRPSYKFLLLGIGAVLLVAISVGATYLVTKNSNNSNQPQQQPVENTVSPVQSSPTSILKNIEIFSNPNIQGFEFEYDPEVWELIEINSENADLIPDGISNKIYGEAGVLMREKNTDGAIFMKYGYLVGRGGAYGAIYEGDYKKISGISRVEVHDNYYIYGRDDEETRTIFSETPEKKKDFERYCLPTHEGYISLSDEECVDLQSGEIIGFYTDPVYVWSLRLKRIGEASEIWGAKDLEYFGESIPEDVQIETQYMGGNPELADEIIKQIFE